MTKKTPKIRFHGFTDAWGHSKLSNTKTYFTDGNYGEAYPKKTDMADSNDGVPFLTGGNLKEGKLDAVGASYITKEKHEQLSSGHLYEDDIVIAVRGSLGALGYVNKENIGWNINSQLAILRTDKTELFGKFLLQFLISEKGQSEILKRQTGSALKQLPLASIKDITIPIITLEEQKKIGEFFSKLDKIITIHQRKLEKLSGLKKAYLEKMFPKKGTLYPELRFKGFTDAWEQRKLSDISNKVTQKNKDCEFSETLTNSAEFGIISQIDFFDHRVSNEDNINGYYIVRDNDFVYNPRISTSAPVGPINRNKLGRTGVMSPLYTVFKPHDVDYSYLEWFFKSSAWHSFMRFNGDSGARSDRFSIKDNVFFTMPIPFPTLNEQRKIGQFFQSIDNLITLHQRKLDKLKQIKSGYLNSMFI